MAIILETERLQLREMKEGDFSDLCRILQDPETMWAYEGAFSDEEVWAWLHNQLRRYREEDGHGLWAVILKESGEMIGQCGLTYQEWGERRVLEVGYLFQRDCWHQGYATEAAGACRDYAFDQLGKREVFSIIREGNRASRAVAERNGMTRRGGLVKHYRRVDMPHDVFSIRRSEWDDLKRKASGDAVLQVREYRSEDLPEMTAVWNAVVEEGNAFPQRESLNPAAAAAFFAGQTYTGVAVREDEIVGLYILHPNNVGRCGHIANASYAVKTGQRGRRIGEALVRDCLLQGARRGFRILQFNAVVASNIAAIHLYEKLGFHLLGRIPGGFAGNDGYQDILLFYIELSNVSGEAAHAGL